MNSTWKLLLIAGILIAVVSNAEGQAKKGKIDGIVTDVMAAVVGRAKVVVTTGTSTVSLETNEDGEFHISLPIGPASITVESPGFDIAKLSRVRVSERARRSLKIVLKVKKIQYGPCPGPDPCIWL